MPVCATCSTENAEGRKFCDNCGASLAAACPACGAANRPGARFCGECGSPLAEQTAATSQAGATSPTAPTGQSTPPPATERRLVSVLFADLVGFTSLTEARDSEDVRALQSRYFDACRRLIELYGGTVEKFIGDAVMAVWGAQAATEDDAERAVRAALDLAAAVSALGDETAVDLKARVGVLTGEATVALGASGEGMVTGDVVNTAARIQALAGAGQVFVGDPTRRATDPAIVYDDAGEHELKGRAGLHRLWRAVRVVSGARGSLRSEGLEAPFVGRDRELRQIKQLFHTCADEGRAHLVSVTGIAGIGKSRLVWEFYKYFDGLAQLVYWHRGRCPSYGEGVTYWALADMVRMRCRIAEDEQPDEARSKLATVLDGHVADADERAFVEPRVAHLLGLEEGAAFAREDLFAAWRVFFERLAAVNPVLLVFEDMQWADSSLLDFIEHLLDWARNSPIFVVTAARPELVEKRPTWGAGKRNFVSLYLEPLPPEAMAELLDGLVVGLSPQLRDQILTRAEGVPLYAVETVRMLIDQGKLVRDGAAHRPVGEITALDVPETLHALIAARLDSLTGAERRLIQDAAVLGKTFTRQSLQALSGDPPDDLAKTLENLTRKEILAVQADPRSPEHGQYGFLQDLVRHVAYEQLPKRERRARHLAAAEHLAASPDPDEVIEVIAAHYLAAHDAQPDGEDGAQLRDRAREALIRAGDRAESLAAAAQASRYLSQAAELTGGDRDRAGLLNQAAEMAGRASEIDRARGLYERSIDLYERIGDSHAAARVLSRLSALEPGEQALQRMERAFAVISGDPPDEDLALLAAQMAIGYWFGGDLERSAERAAFALDAAERVAQPRALNHALRARAFVAASAGHVHENLALLERALALALDHDLLGEAATTYYLLSDRSFTRDRYVVALAYLDQSLDLARRMGSRPYEWGTLSERTYAQLMLGRWDDVAAASAEFSAEQITSGGVVLSMLQAGMGVHVNRGEVEQAERLLELFAHLDDAPDLQGRTMLLAARGLLHRQQGRPAAALADTDAVLEALDALGLDFQTVKQAIVEGVEAASQLGDTASVERLLGLIEQAPPGSRSPYLDAQLLRFRARAAGDPAGFAAAARGFRDLSMPFWLAVTLCEQGELLTSTGDSAAAEPLLTEAREIFTQLRAQPWLERVAAAGGVAVGGG